MDNKRSVQERPLKVFLCHASGDRRRVQEIFTFLEERGIDAWLDRRRLVGGQTWRREIVSAIFESNLVLVCISRNSVDTKGFVNTEIKLALDVAKQEPFGRIFIIPVKLEECEVPFELKEFQWVNLFEEDGYDRLLKSLQTRAKQLAGIRRPSTNPLKFIRESEKPKIDPQMIPASYGKKPSGMLAQWEGRFRKIATPVFLILIVIILGFFATSRLKNDRPSTTVTDTPPALAPIVDDDDGMILIHIPAGEFTSGSKADEQKINLPSYRLDEREVTNAQYLLCVNDGSCRAPGPSRSFTRLNYYNESIYKDYPVINVSWKDAADYCKWAGRRLPSSSEWEKAARGTDGRMYPWGDNPPTGELTNFNNLGRDTVKVATKFGLSPYKIYDMAGNVAEWVLEQVVRGGSWKSTADEVTVFAEKTFPPDARDVTIGFRCAMDE